MYSNDNMPAPDSDPAVSTHCTRCSLMGVIDTTERFMCRLCRAELHACQMAELTTGCDHWAHFHSSCIEQLVARQFALQDVRHTPFACPMCSKQASLPFIRVAWCSDIAKTMVATTEWAEGTDDYFIGCYPPQRGRIELDVGTVELETPGIIGVQLQLTQDEFLERREGHQDPFRFVTLFGTRVVAGHVTVVSMGDTIYDRKTGSIVRLVEEKKEEAVVDAST